MGGGGGEGTKEKEEVKGRTRYRERRDEKFMMGRGAEKIGKNMALGRNVIETVKNWKENVPETNEEKRKSRKRVGKLEKWAERVWKGEEKARERKGEKKNGLSNRIGVEHCLLACLLAPDQR